MLRLHIESAPYTELDFPTFNEDGFRRIQQLVEMAQQQKALAQTSEELREAANNLRAAGERKSLEQQIARQNFEAERLKLFRQIETLQQQFSTSRMPGTRRLEVETRIDHLVTLFNLKDFAAVRREIGNVKEMLNYRPRPSAVPSVASNNGDASESATSLLNKVVALERAENTRHAVEAYGRQIRIRRTAVMMRFIAGDAARRVVT